MFFDILAEYRHQRHGPMPEPIGYTAALKEMIKLIVDNKHDRTPVALYDLNRDPAEAHNLIGNAKYAGTVHELSQELKQWLDQQPAPLSRQR
ncbi:MAG: hypothetical protein HY000_00555 [Planctomycetes bacterium]|nr:hypothetical protein [Planctomycetota bacterium]